MAETWLHLAHTAPDGALKGGQKGGEIWCCLWVTLGSVVLCVRS